MRETTGGSGSGSLRACGRPAGFASTVLVLPAPLAAWCAVQKLLPEWELAVAAQQAGIQDQEAVSCAVDHLSLPTTDDFDKNNLIFKVALANVFYKITFFYASRRSSKRNSTVDQGFMIYLFFM
jgi:hypothetical protein